MATEKRRYVGIDLGKRVHDGDHQEKRKDDYPGKTSIQEGGVEKNGVIIVQPCGSTYNNAVGLFKGIIPVARI